jgi:hypothetical protein
MNVFLMWLIGFFPIKFFPYQLCFIIWVLLIVLCKFDFYMMCCSILKVLNHKLNLKFYQMDCWFEFLDIHMNEKAITCHDCYGFKWKNINIYPILTVFLCSPTPFFACWIVTTFKKVILWPHLWHTLKDFDLLQMYFLNYSFSCDKKYECIIYMI